MGFNLAFKGLMPHLHYLQKINPVKVRVKKSHYRPGQALRVPGG
jgi:hypothetical protein